eukprot:1023798-Prorocentrum_minimum.AAC.1
MPRAGTTRRGSARTAMTSLGDTSPAFVWIGRVGVQMRFQRIGPGCARCTPVEARRSPLQACRHHIFGGATTPPTTSSPTAQRATSRRCSSEAC